MMIRLNPLQRLQRRINLRERRKRRSKDRIANRRFRAIAREIRRDPWAYQRKVERECLAEMKWERENPAFPDLNGKHVGFIVQTKRGYKPFIGTPVNSPGDNDSFIDVIASREAFSTREEALAIFSTCGIELARVFKTPTSPGGIMGHWLRPLIDSEKP